MLLYIVQNNQQMNILYFINIKYRYTVQVHITEGFDWSFLPVHNHIILGPNKEEQVPWSEVKLTVEIQEEWSKYSKLVILIKGLWHKIAQTENKILNMSFL